MKTEQHISCDITAWRSQVKAQFREACRTLHSRPGVPSIYWIVDAMIERAMRYAVEKDKPESET